MIQLPFIKRNIDATRAAFHLDDVEEIPYVPKGPGDPPADVERLLASETLKQAPLWPGLLELPRAPPRHPARQPGVPHRRRPDDLRTHARGLPPAAAAPHLLRLHRRRRGALLDRRQEEDVRQRRARGAADGAQPLARLLGPALHDVHPRLRPGDGADVDGDSARAGPTTSSWNIPLAGPASGARGREPAHLLRRRRRPPWPSPTSTR